MSKQQTQILKPVSLFPEQYGERVGQKRGGAHAPDPDGGIFKNGVDTFLIKRDVEKLQNDIAEYLASQIFRVLGLCLFKRVNSTKVNT